jgi:3-phosphoshikimate 1-carboxyvinyltransferase
LVGDEEKRTLPSTVWLDSPAWAFSSLTRVSEGIYKYTGKQVSTFHFILSIRSSITLHYSSLPMRITPIPYPLNATVRVPGSKSLTNRALLIAALAMGKTKLTNAVFSDDSRYFANALKTLGFDIELDEAAHEMTVTGLGGKIPAGQAELFIGNAGTAARFITALLTLGHGEFIIDGDSRMRERPIGDLVEALTQLGAKLGPANTTNWSLVTDHSKTSPPLKILAHGLPGGQTQIAGDISSQFLSALLMVAPYAQSPVEIKLTTDLNSKPYVDMTLGIMKDFGVGIERNDYSRFIVRPNLYSPISSYPIESDASAASYFFAAPAICGGTVRVENISRNSKQGDNAFLDILQQMGCTVQEADNGILVTGSTELRGIDVDMRDIPDTAQTLAAIAPFASSPTRIRGIVSARLKETDRVHAACTELQRVGVQVEEHEDGMTIYPCDKFQPADIRTYNDHRMAMAFSLIGLHVDGITIENPSCVSKTFPGYFEVLELLR